jgi:AraC family transcriptional regulator of adaptative response/methylated-DNA-[protein]-cysteine methyltransferase
MKTQEELNFNRIAQAIAYIQANYRAQPTLEDIAAHVNLSPFHFQRMFQQWAGVSPKQFIQYLSADYAKNILKNKGSTLFEAAYQTGLSGTGRLHALFIKLEGMTPGEFKNGGESLKINYNFAESLFGEILIASTQKGICYMAFVDEGPELALQKLHNKFPNAGYLPIADMFQQNALKIFQADWTNMEAIKIHLKGSSFQLKIWETLLQIPMGKVNTYAQLASDAGFKGASRAVGTAVGSNPIAFLIPCHRIIRSTGEIGQYHWGSMRKNAMIAWESAQNAGK